MSVSMRKGLLLAALHVAIVASLGGKLMIDRSTYPRVWARAAPVDPDLPIRGRYVRLRVEATVGPDFDLPNSDQQVKPTEAPRATPARRVVLAADQGTLVASPASGTEGLSARIAERDGTNVAELLTPVAFFIPEEVADPSIRPAGEELWVEVTLPRRGPPRPIRIGVKKEGVLTPLDLR